MSKAPRLSQVTPVAKTPGSFALMLHRMTTKLRLFFRHPDSEVLRSTAQSIFTPTVYPHKAPVSRIATHKPEPNSSKSPRYLHFSWRVSDIWKLRERCACSIPDYPVFFNACRFLFLSSLVSSLSEPIASLYAIYI